MKCRNKKVFVLSLCLLCITGLICSERNIHFKLPVRTFVQNKPTVNVEKDDFKLLVNGQETSIVEFSSLKRSISQKTDLGRSLILSFQMAEYNQSIADGISYFVTQHINRNDTLFIVSPLKFYQIRVTGNKGSMISEIDKLLKRDFQIYKKSRTLAEKSLLNKIEKVKIALARREAIDYDIARYTTVIRFLNNHPAEFFAFKKKFLFPDILKIKLIAERISTRGGDKWWIHFQQREVSALFPKTKAIIKKLNWYETIADYNLGYKQGMSHLKKQLQYSYSFPLQEMNSILLKNNVSYNVVLFSGKKDLDLTNVQSELSDLKIVFDEISKKSGGKIINIMTPEQGIREIEKHWDFYSELEFCYNGRLEDKHFKINLSEGNANLSYPEIFSKDDVKSLLQWYSAGKIRIGALKSKEKGVTFSVDSFRLHKNDKYGIVKVSIKLYDAQNKVVYSKNKTLRAFKDEIFVAIPFPVSYCGRYKMKIAVFDLIANQSDSEEHYLEL